MAKVNTEFNSKQVVQCLHVKLWKTFSPVFFLVNILAREPCLINLHATVAYPIIKKVDKCPASSKLVKPVQVLVGDDKELSS